MLTRRMFTAALVAALPLTLLNTPEVSAQDLREITFVQPGPGPRYCRAFTRG